ncbi:MAG: flagellar basal body rod protein FlgC [Planctomycetota bacterium]
MYGSLDISTSGMIAQRTRMTAIAANLANRDTILDTDGNVNPYKRRQALFAPGNPNAVSGQGKALGVHVRQISINEDAVRLKLEPGNPHAYKSGPNEGYVPVPDIDPVVEQVNAMEAARAYEANVSAADASKAMLAQALRLLA